MVGVLTPPSEPTHVIGICGGAVAGSEAAALAAERGAIAIVFEQNPRPYGKIEDGLPRWHRKLRNKEYDRIDDNLDRPNVLFVPQTRIGSDVDFRDLVGEHELSATILANGAWRDRSLPLEGIDEYVGRGLAYQNPFVYWFNHHEEPGYDGPRFEVTDGAIVIGGGLASIDVVKVINLVLYRRALRERGIEIDVVELEHRGIDEVLQDNGLDPQELGIRGCTLYYRRRKQDMPLASAPKITPKILEKLQKARVKIMEKVERKYLVNMSELSVPIAPIIEGDRLRGLVFQRSEIVDGRVKTVEGSDFEVRTGLVVSSIGSVPEPIEGLPMEGELYRFDNDDTGELEGMLGVYGLGNVLTGRGNIKDSRSNAAQIAAQILDTFLGNPDGAERDRAGDEMANAIHSAASKRAEKLVDKAMLGKPLPPEQVAKIYELVESRWRAAGYDGDYRAWIAQHPAPDRG